MEQIKWYSTTEYVDIETGEMITKSNYERGNYRTIKKTKKIEINETTNNNKRFGTIKWTIEIRESEQTKLQFG